LYLGVSEEIAKIKNTRLNINNVLFFSYIFLATFIIIFSTFTYTTYAAAENYTFVNKWGSHGDSDGQFEEPTGIVIDSSNDVYVSDMDFENCCNPLHHIVKKFTDNGSFITKWGGNGAFVNPMGLAIDSLGNVYVADQVHQRIAKFTNNGTFIADWSSQINPTDIAIDSSDNVYVTEMFDSRIAKFASDGT
jgi:DNA-binding beta-propeller fold protein YncE